MYETLTIPVLFIIDSCMKLTIPVLFIIDSCMKFSLYQCFSIDSCIIWWLYVHFFVLSDVQEAFHRDFNANCITMDGWHPNATDEGILGYKLMVQTGDIDDPIDKNRVSCICWSEL